MNHEKQKNKIALFRLALIAPVIHRTIPGTAAEYFRKATMNELDHPVAGRVRYSPVTLKGWLADYREGGFEALIPKQRTDAGHQRAVSSQIGERIKQILTDHPKIPCTVIRDRLVGENLITGKSPSETTLRRYVRSSGLRMQLKEKPEGRRAFEKSEPNELWTLDYMHGPKIAGMKSTPRLLAIIDDASRYIVLGIFLASESYKALAPRLVTAFGKHGIPLALYCDNGASFSSNDLALTCARLKISLIHSRPYIPQGRGKIERFFRTVRQRFLTAIEPEALVSLDTLNAAFSNWLETSYHRRIHSSLNATPLERFLRGKRPKRWVSKEELHEHFQRTIIRKVKTDSTVSIDGTRYEVTPEWIGKKVELRAPINAPGQWALYFDGQPQLKLSVLDMHANDQINYRARFAGSSS